MKGLRMHSRVEVLMTYDLSAPADILLAVQAIPMADQQLFSDNLLVNGAEPMQPIIDPFDGSTRTWFIGEGRVTVDYVAEVLVERPRTALAGKSVGKRIDLPVETVPCLFPSRYCESDRLQQFVNDTFVGQGESDGDRVEIMVEWICEHLTYMPGISTATTTAVDTFLARRGVCRDYTHLLIAFARAAGIPARAVSVYAPGLDPQDFHAVVEVWLDGGWHLIDPARMAPEEYFIRIATGRDATDISFMSIFGTAMLVSQRVNAFALDRRPPEPESPGKHS